jgi:hypothetical protein
MKKESDVVMLRCLIKKTEENIQKRLLERAVY